VVVVLAVVEVEAVLEGAVVRVDTGVGIVHPEEEGGGRGVRVTVATAATAGAEVRVETEVGMREAEGRPLGGHPSLYTKGGARVRNYRDGVIIGESVFRPSNN